MTRILITGKDSYIGKCFLSHVSESPDFLVEELDVQKTRGKVMISLNMMSFFM